MERQYLKLMDMIAAIVGTLDKREMFQSIISHSGRQHAQFGAKPSHFAALGDALIWGLEQQFGALERRAGAHRTRWSIMQQYGIRRELTRRSLLAGGAGSYASCERISAGHIKTELIPTRWHSKIWRN